MGQWRQSYRGAGTRAAYSHTLTDFGTYLTHWAPNIWICPVHLLCSQGIQDECPDPFTENNIRRKQKNNQHFYHLLATLSFNKKGSVRLKCTKLIFGLEELTRLAQTRPASPLWREISFHFHFIM